MSKPDLLGASESVGGFANFEKLHDPEAYPGTGMSLAIVEKAVQRRGGRVGVDSTT